MTRGEIEAAENDVVEDRLSAVLALALVGANLAGCATFAVLKTFQVPPLIASSTITLNDPPAQSLTEPRNATQLKSWIWSDSFAHDQVKIR